MIIPAYPGHHEAGSVAALEHVKAFPILIVAFAILGVADRASTAELAVHQASSAAARAASLSRTTDQAHTLATTAARRSLDEQGIRCEPAATVSVSGDMRPGGTARVTVTCTVTAANAYMPFVSFTKSDTGSSFVDPYRSGK